MPLCDTLLRCAEEPALFHPLWSEETLREVHRVLLKFHLSVRQADRRVHAMQDAFPEALVRVPAREIMNVQGIPDLSDRHVAAAAIRGKANVIVTFNRKHFPPETLTSIGIVVRSPDEFLLGLLREKRGRVLEALDNQACAIGQTKGEVLDRLRPGLPKFVKLAGADSP